MARHDLLSIDLLKDALHKLGYSYSTLILDDEHYTRFTAPNRNAWLTSNLRINYPFTANTARTISKNKNKAYDLAQSIGINIPKTKLVVRGEPRDNKSLTQLLKMNTLVVKPNNASLSRGLTTNINDIPSLNKAIDLAMTFSDKVIVQQQITGNEIRFALLNGKVVAALIKQTPRVVGDGSSSVRELLANENSERRSLVLPYISYPALVEPLISLRTVDMSKVLKKDEVLELGSSTMIKGGASIYNILSRVHQSYIDTAEQLGGILSKGFFVVDIIIQDHSLPQTKQNYAFIEFNMAPVLKLFYSCRDYKNYDIVPSLVKLIDRSLSTL
jgi:cyanophycin synthetase